MRNLTTDASALQAHLWKRGGWLAMERKTEPSRTTVRLSCVSSSSVSVFLTLSPLLVPPRCTPRPGPAASGAEAHLSEQPESERWPSRVDWGVS